MKTSQDHTAASKYIDKNVIYFLLIMLLFSSTILAYQIFSSFPCEEVKISVDAKEYRVGELITFIDYTEGSTIRKWDFGDNSKGSTKREALHVFDKPGLYQIQLFVNNTCSIDREISIQEKKFVLDTTKVPELSLPDKIVVGELLTVADATENAYSWEWRFGETARANATTKEASYRFEEPGLKTVSLIVNGDIEHIAKKRITVLPKEIKKEEIRVIKSAPKITQEDLGWDIPYEPEERKKAAKKEATKVVKEKISPYISEPAFKKRLLQFSKGNGSEKQFAPYFCGDIDKGIIVNGKRTTFLLFCQKIKRKPIDIKQLTLFRNKGSNCIQNANITYKKGITGLFN